MRLQKILFHPAFVLLLIGFCFHQNAPAQTNAAKPNNQAVKSSAAYAEVLLRRAELESEVESLLTSYTEDFPKVLESRHELELVNKDLEMLLKQTDASKLTLALGKLLVRRAELGNDLWMMQKKFGEEHPEVKRAKKKFSSFDNAVREILPQ